MGQEEKLCSQVIGGPVVVSVLIADRQGHGGEHDSGVFGHDHDDVVGGVMSTDVMVCPSASLCGSDGEHDRLCAGWHTEGPNPAPPSHDFPLDVREDIHSHASRNHVRVPVTYSIYRI